MSTRERALERTFMLYRRHFGLWLSLLAPVAMSAAFIWVALQRALAGASAGHPDAVGRAVAAIPHVAAGVWLVAGGCGGQAIALVRIERGDDVHAWSILPPLARRSLHLLAVATLMFVGVTALGLLGIGLAGALAHIPLIALPAAGASATTAKSVSLLVLLPMLVAGVVPALWWFGRHVVALPLVAVVAMPARAALTHARRVSRGHVGTILGLFIVTALASNVVVLLARAVGSLATLLIAPERFRPIFGTGPWEGAAGPEVQLAATLVATRPDPATRVADLQRDRICPRRGVAGSVSLEERRDVGSTATKDQRPK